MHLCSTSIIKITVNKMAISPECFVCIRWDLQNWKNQSSNLTVGTEGITQLLKSNFEWPKCKWKHQCHAFAKKGTFFEHVFLFHFCISHGIVGLIHITLLLAVSSTVIFVCFFVYHFQQLLVILCLLTY